MYEYLQIELGEHFNKKKFLDAHHFWDFKIRETTITNLHGLYTATVGKFTKYANTRNTDFFDVSD